MYMRPKSVFKTPPGITLLSTAPSLSFLQVTTLQPYQSHGTVSSKVFTVNTSSSLDFDSGISPSQLHNCEKACG